MRQSRIRALTQRGEVKPHDSGCDEQKHFGRHCQQPTEEEEDILGSQVIKALWGRKRLRRCRQ
eukprot:2495807-Heterocapsa_arctica.AAC.1